MSQTSSCSPTGHSTIWSPGSRTSSGRCRCRQASPGATPITRRPCARSSTTTPTTTRWVPDMLAGKTMAEAGKDNFAGDLLGDNPKGQFRGDRRKGVRGGTGTRRSRPCRALLVRRFSAREYFWQINSFRGLRAHDLARVIGVDPALPDDLVQGLWDEISPHADEWRKYGVFPPAVPVPDTAPAAGPPARLGTQRSPRARGQGQRSAVVSGPRTPSPREERGQGGGAI